MCLIMENYKKGKNIEEELTQDRIPIDNLPEKFLWMHVKGGTKITNVVEYAEKAFDSGEYRSVVWSGSGGGVPKTISCSEVMKRNYEVHQVTRLAYQKIDEYWDPLLSGLDPIIVTRQVPAIHIFLSLDEVDPKTAGYQKANVPTSFWPEPAPKQQKRDEDYVYKNKRNFNGNSRNNNQSRSAPRGGHSNNSRPQNNQQSKDSQAQNKRHTETSKTKANPTTQAPGTSSQSQEATKS